MGEPIKIKVFMGRKIFTFGNDFHETQIFLEGKKLKKGFAYIKGEMVYIFRGKLKKVSTNMVPGIYLTSDGEYKFVEPPENDKELYSINNVMELSLDRIFSDLENNTDDFTTAEDIEKINNNSETFTPVVHESDDPFKKAVKSAIILKQINLKNCKEIFSNPHALNNLKSSLIGETGMTVKNFLRWMEILNIDWKLSLKDDGQDKFNPLQETLNFGNKERG